MNGMIIGRNGETVVNLREIEFHQESGSYIGKVESANLPTELKDALIQLFELIEDQTFARVDEAQARADAFDLSVRLENGKQHHIESLAYNGKDWFGFKIRESQDRRK